MENEEEKKEPRSAAGSSPRDAEVGARVESNGSETGDGCRRSGAG